jgi:hypothetical protein
LLQIPQFDDATPLILRSRKLVGVPRG